MCMLYIQEEEEESFVMTSLLTAAEEGNVDVVNELMESSSHFDINLANRVRSFRTSIIFVNRNETNNDLNFVNWNYTEFLN